VTFLLPRLRLAHHASYPQDGITWGAATSYGSWLQTSDEVYPTAWTTMSSIGASRYIQFGLEVMNATGTQVEVCHASLRVDIVPV